MRAAAILTILTMSWTSTGLAQQQAKFSWHHLSEGVYLVQPNSMGSNSLVVIGDTAVLLVDSQIAPASARLLVQELREITDLPVSHVVNTHWHLDHVGGNEAIREAYPGIQVVAHARAAEEGRAGGEEQRKRASDFWRRTLGDEISQVDRESLRELDEPYRLEPDVGLSGSMRVDLGGRTVEVIAMPGGHTGGDLIAHLPAEQIVAGGDLILMPLFGSRGSPSRHLESLGQVLELDARLVIPGHGPPLSGTSDLAEQSSQLEALISTVTDAFQDSGDEDAVVTGSAPGAGSRLGDPEGLVRAIIRELAGGPSQPELVGPGIISTGNVWRGAFSPDGSELYFFRKMTPNEEDYRIFVTTKSGQDWANPRQVEFSGSDSDLYPTISPDGRRMVLTSYRGIQGMPPNAYLFMSRLEDGAWTTPLPIPGLNEPGVYHAQPYFTQDGTLYFRRVGQEGPRMFRTEPSGDGFGEPEELDFRSPFGAPELDIAGAFLSPDECRAVLTVRVGRGDVDLYWSDSSSGTWNEPIRLGEGFNSDGMDLFPFFRPNGRELYFVRQFGELYVSRIPVPTGAAECPRL